MDEIEIRELREAISGLQVAVYLIAQKVQNNEGMSISQLEEIKKLIQVE